MASSSTCAPPLRGAPPAKPGSALRRLTAPAVLALIAALWYAVDPLGVFGMTKVFSGILTGRFGLRGCEEMRDVKFRIEHIGPVEPLENFTLPLGEEFMESLDKVKVIHSTELAKAAPRILDSFGHYNVTLRGIGDAEACIVRSLLPPEICISAMSPTMIPETLNFGDLMAGKAKSRHEGGVYGGGLSFNASYDIFDGIFDSTYYRRNDAFVGNLNKAVRTAGFHSNIAEHSVSIQLEGHKLWMFMDPTEFRRETAAFPNPTVLLPTNICDSDLRKATVYYAVTGPGDIVAFPRTFPHFVIGVPGPNLMITLRLINLKELMLSPFLLSLADRISLFSTLGRIFFSSDPGAQGKTRPVRLDATAKFPTVFRRLAEEAYEIIDNRATPAPVSLFLQQLCEDVRENHKHEAWADVPSFHRSVCQDLVRDTARVEARHLSGVAGRA